jgi:glycosyltransferase involved in cell wall biosynthesis
VGEEEQEKVFGLFMCVKLSIITINKNNADGLRKTIKSVVSQTFKNFEFIVIDGASTDESVNIINEYSKHITYSVSEPDEGIYYAMNKGIKAASGEYCLFLNSGDYLISNSALKKAFSYDFFEDIVYGNVIIENILKQKMHRICNSSLSILNIVGMSGTLVTNHQSSFIKLNLFSRFGLYRTDLSISSDQDFFIKTIFEYGVTYRYIPVTFSVHGVTGIATQNFPKASREIYKFMLELLKHPALYNSIKSVSFYDNVWNTPLVKFWYNFYNTICEFKLKIKGIFGKDFHYNNFKFLKLAYKKFAPKKIPKGKKLLAWGTGADGFLVYNYCYERKIFIYAFIDSSEAKQQYAFLGRPVFAPKFAFENKDKDFFIVVASRDYCDEISKTCREAGLVEGKDFVVPFEMI